MKVQDAESAARRVETAPKHYRSMMGGETARFAVVRNINSVDAVLAYLPANYVLCESFPTERGVWAIIGGQDNAGWTLDGYVIPRLASGLYAAEEIQ